jgi:diadenosine tetraphosphate (Ap4A) HIT family hydrolase
MPCPFCERIHRHEYSAESMHAVAFPDGYPLSEGHTLVVPRRHVSSVYDLAPDEQADVWALAARVRAALAKVHRPAGFNVGLNDGAAAGQTIAHAHVHVIPRYEGDVPDPRGGVRWVIPGKAPYWDESADHRAVTRAADREAAAMRDGDSEAFATILTDDAVMLPPNVLPKTGAELRRWLGEFLEGFRVEWLSLTHDETVVSGDLAYHVYTYAWRVTPKKGGDGGSPARSGRRTPRPRISR